MSDLYAILGLPRTASPPEIRAAYIRLAKQHHPDTGGSVDAFRAAEQAYRVLSDPAERAYYDATGSVLPKAQEQNAEAPVYQMACELITEALVRIQDPSTGDVIAKALGFAAEAKTKIGEKLTNQEEMHRRLQIAVKRVKAKTGDNRLGAVLESHAAKVEHLVMQSRQNLELLERARVFLEGYRYEADLPPQMVQRHYGSQTMHPFGMNYFVDTSTA